MKEYKSEYTALEHKVTIMRDKLENYPKGALRRRTIKGRDYYYLQYREGKHVRSEYVQADKAENVRFLIEERRELEQNIKDTQSRLETYARFLGIHRYYRPVKNVDYEDYTQFISTVAHDYKSMALDVFIEKYDTSKYRGINKRYIAGFLDYISGVERGNMRKTNDLVLDFRTYKMYFECGNKDVLEQELKKAIPAFLNRGLLVTNCHQLKMVASIDKRE